MLVNSAKSGFSVFSAVGSTDYSLHKLVLSLLEQATEGDVIEGSRPSWIWPGARRMWDARAALMEAKAARGFVIVLESKLALRSGSESAEAISIQVRILHAKLSPTA